MKEKAMIQGYLWKRTMGCLWIGGSEEDDVGTLFWKEIKLSQTHDHEQGWRKATTKLNTIDGHKCE